MLHFKVPEKTINTIYPIQMPRKQNVFVVVGVVLDSLVVVVVGVGPVVVVVGLVVVVVGLVVVVVGLVVVVVGLVVVVVGLVVVAVDPAVGGEQRVPVISDWIHDWPIETREYTP
jgi:hypothetical protein